MKRTQIFTTLMVFLVHRAVGSGSHSLVFLSSGLVKPQTGIYYEQLTVFDGVPVSHCDSQNRTEQFKPVLQSAPEEKDCENAYVDLVDFFHDIQDHTNLTVEVVQRRRGCSQSADGTVTAFEAWAVNGMVFMTFDPETLKWTSKAPLASGIKELWDGQLSKRISFSDYMKTFCPKVIQHVKLKTVSKNTDLRVFAKPIEDSDEAQLRCHVTTTDKSIKTVRLIGDGASRVSGISVMGPLPSGDDSVIFRLNARISLRHSSLTYGCALQSEGHDFTVYWNGNTVDGRYIYHSVIYKSVPAIIGFITVIVVILVISCTIIYLQKCVKMRPTPAPPPPGPELTEQFENFIQSSTRYPDIRNILLSYMPSTNTPERQRNLNQEWLEMKEREDNYDPEFYARWV